MPFKQSLKDRLAPRSMYNVANNKTMHIIVDAIDIAVTELVPDTSIINAHSVGVAMV